MNDDVTVTPYALRLATPWVTARGRENARRGFLVQIGDSFGDAAPLPGSPESALAKIHDAIVRAGDSEKRRPKGPARHAILQAALSEQARQAHIPLSSLLGEPHQRIPRSKVFVNATIPVCSVAASLRRARAFVEDGYRTIKLKVTKHAREIERVARVREHVGAHVSLRVDPNGAWDPSTAAVRLDALEPLQIQYVEQPIPPGRPRQFLRLAERSPIPIAPDEDATDLDAIAALLSDAVLEYVIVKPMVLGGPDLATQAILAVEDAGATPIITDVVESGVGRAAALHVAALTKDARAAHGLASGNLLQADLVSPPLVPNHAAFRTPRRPGLGVKVRRTRA